MSKPVDKQKWNDKKIAKFVGQWMWNSRHFDNESFAVQLFIEKIALEPSDMSWDSKTIERGIIKFLSQNSTNETNNHD